MQKKVYGSRRLPKPKSIKNRKKYSSTRTAVKASRGSGRVKSGEARRSNAGKTQGVN